jgi:glycosyltransferase involved in cell wall biosynthesis
MSRLRFCMVTTFYPPYNFGGDGIGVQRLARALVRRGHDVTVIHDADAFLALHRGEEPAAGADDDGVDVMRLRSRLRTLSPLLTQQTGRPIVHGRAIRRLLDDGAFDVINFHNISLVGGPGILSAGRGLKVMMAHEHWLVCPTHVLWRHGREPCPGKQCTRCVLRSRKLPQYWRYTGFLERQLRHVDLFIAISEFSRAKHREFGFPREMEVLPCFLPASAAAEDAHTDSSPHARPYFLFVGRLERIKGLDDVIPLFREFREADLLVAGEGTHAATLKRLAADLPHVRFLGGVPEDRLDDYYRHALALVVPSVCFETFGIIVIEAFRHGVPVLARRIGPLPDLVERSGGGSVFETPAELLAALRRLHAEPGRRAQLGEAARQAFEDHWSEDVVVPRYLELIRSAAERAGRPGFAAKPVAEAFA